VFQTFRKRTEKRSQNTPVLKNLKILLLIDNFGRKIIMVDLLTLLAASVLILQAFIGLSYFVSSIWEKETRASIFAALQFLFMLVPVVIFFVLILSTRFFETGLGLGVLIAGLVIVALDAFIANLGYSATANFVFHYETLLAPLAVDAGLGQGGRLGYLMTREFGPRLRLAGITTDLPLIPDKPVDIGVEDFCKICKKCAVCCPSGSILHGEPGVFNGTQRWKLNAETCFEYWAKIGSDCNICMRVCPWSHARTFPHRFIAWMITRNKISRRLFYHMDDLFYGKKPKPNIPPRWAEFRSGLT
jgi:hypothetical protein